MGSLALRPYQQAAETAVLQEWEGENKKTLLVLPTGCHAIGERILLADGSIKPVEDIQATDLLMGSDGTPRKIFKIIHGNGKLYRICPVKGKPFLVNEDHLLTLIRTSESSNPKYPSENRGGEVIDVTVKEWLSWKKWRKHLYKLIRASTVEFYHEKKDNYPIDPYFLGVLLGDGWLNGASIGITTMDTEVVNVIYQQAKIHGLRIRTEPAGKATTYIFQSKERYVHSKFIKSLKEMGLRNQTSGTKHVPIPYKTASVKIRLQIIAGLLDSDGHLTCNGYDFISKSPQLSNDLAFMCRSVGLAAYVSECQKKCGEFTGTYYRVSISGNCDSIPMKIPHKIAKARKQKKNVLVTGFTVKYACEGSYIGFTVDKDNRYLLDDFTITHNCGKTIVFAKITEDRVRVGERVLIMAHREELLKQAADKIEKATGLKSAVEKAEQSCKGSWYRVVVGSVQTLTRDKRLKQFSRDFFDTIIIDEAHHSVSDSYQHVLQYFDGAKVLGVTATPDRSDMRNLGTYYNSLAYEYSLPQAIKDGYLSKIVAQTIPLTIDISGVGFSAGDYKMGELGTALDPYLAQIAQEMLTYCADRKTVVFLPLVKTSQKFCELLNQAGFNAAEVNGNSNDREQVLQDFDAGKYNVLCNSMLLTEGWDCPSVDCVIVLRATKSRSLYSQMVGRGTRLYPGKDHVLLLDFLWNTEKHELCRPACLIAESEDVAAKMTEKLNESGKPEELEVLEQEASEDVVSDREAALADKLAAMKKRKRRLVDPLQFEMSIQAEDLSGYVPSFGWEMGPATKKQLDALEKFGVFGDEIENAGKAKLILDKLIKRKESGLATPRQIRLLESRGFQHVGTWTFAAATKLIGRIAARGWRIPSDIKPAEYIPEA
jgi:superfamily II DNA or RNA helicase